VVGMYLCSWAFFCLVQDAHSRWRDLGFNGRLFFQRNRAYVGALLAHVGMLICIVGFLGNYRGMETTVTLRTGESAQLYGYDFAFSGIEPVQIDNALHYEAPLKITRDGRDLGVMRPAQAIYPTKPEPLTEVAVRGAFWHDIYIILAGFNQDKSNEATLKIHINPTVRFVWISIYIMVLGSLICLFDRFRGERSRDVVAGTWETGRAATKP